MNGDQKIDWESVDQELGLKEKPESIDWDAVDQQLGLSAESKEVITAPMPLTTVEQAPEKIGIGEMLREHIDLSDLIPFSMNPWYKAQKEYNARQRLKKAGAVPYQGKEKDIELVKYWDEYRESRKKRGATTGAQIVEGVSILPKYMGEFLLTAGAASLVEGAYLANPMVQALMKSGKVGKLASDVGRLAVRAMARMPLFQGQVQQKYLERQMPRTVNITPKGEAIFAEAQEKPFTSAFKAFGDVYFEIATEETGEFIGKAAKVPLKIASKKIPAVGKVINQLEKTYLKLVPGATVKEFLDRIATKAGYNGLLGEMGEERLNDVLRATFDIDPRQPDEDGDSVFRRIIDSVPNAEQILVEAGVLSFPGITKTALGMGAKAITKESRKTQEAYDKINQSIEDYQNKRPQSVFINEEDLSQIDDDVQNFLRSNYIDWWKNTLGGIEAVRQGPRGKEEVLRTLLRQEKEGVQRKSEIQNVIDILNRARIMKEAPTPEEQKRNDYIQWWVDRLEEGEKVRKTPEGRHEVLKILEQQEIEGLKKVPEIDNLIGTLREVIKKRETEAPKKVRIIKPEAKPEITPEEKPAVEEELPRYVRTKMMIHKLVYLGRNNRGYYLFRVPSVKDPLMVDPDDMANYTSFSLALKDHLIANKRTGMAKKVRITPPRKPREIGAPTRKRPVYVPLGQRARYKAEIEPLEKFETQEIPAGSIAEHGVGAKFKIKGEEYEVKRADPGNILIEDGERFEVDEFDKIPVDRGEVKGPEGRLRPKPIEKTSGEPIRAYSKRWESSRAAMPGEPLMWLDSEDVDDAKAAIIEREDDQGYVIYQLMDSEGNFLGEFETVEQAAEAGEEQFPIEEKKITRDVKTGKEKYMADVRQMANEAETLHDFYRNISIRIHDLMVREPIGRRMSGELSEEIDFYEDLLKGRGKPKWNQPKDFNAPYRKIYEEVKSEEKKSELPLKAKGLKPNNVYIIVRNDEGKVIDLLSKEYNGTPENAIEIGKPLHDKAMDNPDASGIETQIATTDKIGNLRHIISPNFKNIAEATTKEARYILGDVSVKEPPSEKVTGAPHEQIVEPGLKGRAQMPKGKIRVAGPIKPVEGGEGVGVFKTEETGEQKGLFEEKPTEIPSAKPLKLYRGGDRPGNWFTSDREAAQEYADLHEKGILKSITVKLNKIAEPKDILETAEQLGLSDAKDQAPYWLVSPEQYHGANQIINSLKRKGYDAVHLPMGEDFSPDGKEIESYLLLREVPPEIEGVPTEKPKVTGGGRAGGSYALVSDQKGSAGVGYGKIEVSEPKPKSLGQSRSVHQVSSQIDENKLGAAVDNLKKIAMPAKRSELSREGARILRMNIAQLAYKKDIHEQAFKDAHKHFAWMSREEAVDFMDRMEKGEPQQTEKLDNISRKVRELLDGLRDQVQALGKGYLEKYYENYFPHIWKNPVKARDIISSIMGRKPLTGPKSFLKKRSIVTVKEGVDYGLEPVSWNPIDLVLLKAHEMERFLMAHRIIQDLKGRGLIKFKYVKAKMPEGHGYINDNAFTVFMPPEIGIQEAYDQLFVDNLMDIAKSLGIDAKRLMKLKMRAWGYAQGKERVRTKFAGPESVLAHEIGHILGNRYNLYEWIINPPGQIYKGGKKKGLENLADKARHRKLINDQLRALADLRYQSIQAPEAYKKYVRKAEEKEAVMLEALFHAPEEFKKIAPDLYARFTQFLNDHAELRPLLDIKPSLVLGSQTGAVKVPGVTELGRYVAPEHIARLLNNYLSPGLRRADNALVAGTYDLLRKLANSMNYVNLSFSFFHGINTTTDVWNTHFGLGLRQLLATPGQRIEGIKTLLTYPAAPFTNLWRGNNLEREMRKDLSEIKDPEMQMMVEAVIMAGGRRQMDIFYHNQAAKSLQNTLRDLIRGSFKEKIKGSIKLPINLIGSGIEIVTKPVMEWLVPRQKLGAFMLMAQHEFKRRRSGQIDDEQLWQRLVESWDNVDNRMGQLVYDNLFWNKTLKDSLMLSFRSVGWNLGSWREYAGAPVDLITTQKRIKGGDVWISEKMAYVAGAAFTYSILGAVLTYLLTGKRPEEWKDYFFPKTGNKNVDGSDERLSLPTYAKDWYAYSQRPITTLSHKMHPIWTTLWDTWKNEDFYGTEIRHKDDPLMKQLLQTAEFWEKSFLPFSVRNYEKMRRDGDSLIQSMAVSATGITSAPSYVTRSPAQKKMIEYIVLRMPQGARTKEQYQRSLNRKKLVYMARIGYDVLTHPLAKGMTPAQLKSIIRESKLEPFAAQFKRLNLKDALNVYSIANEEERKQVLSILKDKFARSTTYKNDPDVRKLYLELVKPEQRMIRIKR